MAIIAFATVFPECGQDGRLYVRVHVACEGNNKRFDYLVDPPDVPIDYDAVIAATKAFIDKHGKHFRGRKVDADQIRLFIPNEVIG
jgi:hypothetical protein